MTPEVTDNLHAILKKLVCSLDKSQLPNSGTLLITIM